MTKNLKVGLGVLAVLVAILLPVGIVVNYYNTPGEYDEFAQCINDSGANYYAAFWCPHCQSQSARFGKSQKYLPRTECSTPDGRGQLQVCSDVGVESYPTWIFADGERVTGDQSLEFLAEKTGCELNPGV